MKPEKLFAKKINDALSKKSDELQKFPGIIGDGNGSIYFGSSKSSVYIQIGNQVAIASCVRVQPVYGLSVWVGYVNEERTLYQVLSTRTSDAANTSSGGSYAPADRYRYLSPTGGQDPLWIESRAWLPLRVGMTSTPSMSVAIYEGSVWTGSEAIYVASQNVSLSAHVPSVAGKAALVLLSVNLAGDIVQTKGSEVDLDDLCPVGDEYVNAPAVPSGTSALLALIRVYYGQTEIREGRNISSGTNRGFTDFMDLRFVGFSGGGVDSISGDGVNNSDPANPVLTFPTAAEIGAEPARGADDNYVTDAQLVVIGNTSGTNTGDQTVINPPTTTATNDFQVGDGSGSWITKTLAQTVTILRTALDSVFATLVHTHNASSPIVCYLSGSTVPAGVTFYGAPGKIGLDAVANNVPWPVGGVVSNLSFRISATQPASGSLVITLVLNTVATSLVITIPAGATVGTYTNNTDTVLITANDLLQIKVVNNATAASASAAAASATLTTTTS